jgi:hypothetical protein
MPRAKIPPKPQIITSQQRADDNWRVEIVEAAQRQAMAMHEVWGLSRAVNLADAHRLLDPAALSDVLVTCLVHRMQQFGLSSPDRNSSGDYAFPAFPFLRDFLQEWSWQWMLDGKLIVSGINATGVLRGKRFIIAPDRLKLFEPDYQRSSLTRNGKELVCDVLAEPPSLAMTITQVRRRVANAELDACVSKIIRTRGDSRPPSRDELQKLVEAELGCSIQRDRVREARKRLAPPAWQTLPGRPHR